MDNQLAAGLRVRHATKADWGLGQVVSVDLPKVTVFFEFSGEKTLQTTFVSLEAVEGTDALSEKLDAKFSKKRSTKRTFAGSAYFNNGRSASRKQFIQQLGGTCANWNWSWSFVNHNAKKIFFGAWKDMCEGDRALILSESWRIRNGRNRPSWPEALENLRMVGEEGYSLHVYTMIADPNGELEYAHGPRKIAAILNDLSEARLQRVGSEWYAIFPTEP